MINREDMRVVKTEKALNEAMYELLTQKEFNRIRVNELCDHAQISRAAFYAHFTDKYDLLACWLAQLRQGTLRGGQPYDQVEQALNGLIAHNRAIIKNLLFSADKETLDVVSEFILSTLKLPQGGEGKGRLDARGIVLNSFYAGGVIQYLLWLAENKFPAELVSANTHFLEMITYLQKW